MNRELAMEIDELPQEDFYEVMEMLADMNDCNDIDSFTNWLNEVLYEIKGIIEHPERY